MGRPSVITWLCIWPVWRAIPEDLYEAAALDGSTEIQMFFQVTLPLIWSNIRTTLTFYIISTINLSFQFVQIMSDGGPNGHSEVFLNYMYKQAYGAGVYGYGMAIGVVVFPFLVCTCCSCQ